MNSTSNTILDCHSAYIIYLITCSHLQHLEETVQKLNKRINGHMTGFRNPLKHGTVKFYVNMLLLECIKEPNIKSK